MTVYDLRGRSRYNSPVLIGQQAVGNLAQFMRSEQEFSDRQKKDYEKLYLESANEALIQTLSIAGAEGWDNKKTHGAIMNIPDWAKTKAGERYAFSVLKTPKGQSILDNLKFWIDAEKTASLQIEEGKPEPPMIQFARDQQKRLLRQINPGWSVGGGEAHPPQPPEDQTGSPIKPIAAEKDIENEFVGPPEVPETAESRMKRATSKHGKRELELARQALGEKTLDEVTARAILMEAGGDKEKARQIARQRGYKF